MSPNFPNIANMKLVTLSIIPLLFATSHADLIWTVGLPGDGWPQDGTAGGQEAVFVAESGTNDLPGDPAGPVVDRESDDDYYFAGVYTTVLDGGAYEPLGPVAENEQGAERAFAGADNSLRYHFNFPSTIGATTPLSVSWDVWNLHEADDVADSRYGLEVYVNGVRVDEETVVRPDLIGVINTTPTFTLADVNGMAGEGFDNYVELRGINYNAEGGGNWMGIDHVALDAALEADGIVVDTEVALAATGAVETFELTISNASQDTPLTINDIEIAGDDASKFSIVTAMPFTIAPNEQQTVEYTFDGMGDVGAIAASFVIKSDDPNAAEVSVALAGIIHDPVLAPIDAIDFGTSATSVTRALEISNTGLSQDLVIESITFTGVSANAFSATNPGTIAAGAMGQSTVTFSPPVDQGFYQAVLVITTNDPVSPVIEVTVTAIVPSEGTLIWTVGLPGDRWPQDGMAGGPETVFVAESGTNELPGDPAGPVVDRESDDDYYFAGVYTTVLDGGDYDPIGVVAENEQGAERAFAASDNTLRYHFNLPSDIITLGTPLSVSWDATHLHLDGDDPRYGVEVYYNGILLADELVIRPDQTGVINSTPSFTLPDVNGKTGEGFDNYVELRGINYNDAGGGNWMGIDHVSLVALPNERFEITEIDRVDGNVSLTWLSKSGGFYAVDASVDLVTWETVISDHPQGGATGNTASYTDTDIPMEVTDRYYRVRQVPAPAVYTTDFEDGADGWTASVDQGDTAWELGTPSAEGITTANSGTQAWGTNIAGDYTPNSLARLRSPVIDISGASPRVALEFMHFNDTTDIEGTLVSFLDENGEVLVSLNDADDIITGQTDGWQLISFPIPEEAQGGNVIIEFQFIADEDDEVAAGTYIDDVKID